MFYFCIFFHRKLFHFFILSYLCEHTLSKDIYCKCIDVFNLTDSDVVDFKTTFITNEKTNNDECDEIALTTKQCEDILFDYLYRGQMEQCPFSVCRKVYKRSLWDGIDFPEGKINEDIVTNFKVLKKASKLVHISNIGYYYFQDNNHSITSGALKKCDFDLLDASKELCELSLSCSDKRINDLAKVKLARSYFSLLAKAATCGIAEDISKGDLKFLTKNLRKNYNILIKSGLPLNRKLLVTATSIDYRMLSAPYKIAKLIRGGVFGKTIDKRYSSSVQC